GPAATFSGPEPDIPRRTLVRAECKPFTSIASPLRQTRVHHFEGPLQISSPSSALPIIRPNGNARRRSAISLISPVLKHPKVGRGDLIEHYFFRMTLERRIFEHCG